MCFFKWTLQLFSRLKNNFVPNPLFVCAFGNLLLYLPLYNANMLRLRNPQRYNIYLYSSF